ncbi:NDR1/HIN1-like protein 13 [Syzygium oleosum]|uniref:NDR1/HIN1-like protein 13 n=1 Tax=Syzygium oleosum TaxID=219896 RepID=UPI0024BA71D7|nr:NDR1/HIN1-like protein 13 [Syzygium oleosum]
MADRVHPRDSPPPPPSPPRSPEPGSPRKPLPPPDDKPVPPLVPGTYVIQIPKDQIYRVPPPENEGRYGRRTRRENPRRPLRRCCCCSIAAVAALVVLLAAAAGVFYLVVRPRSPGYAVSGISIGGLNLTSSSPVSPAMDVAVRANNPNGKIGIYYLEGSSAEVYYADLKLCDGALPAFYQPANNVTVLDAALKGGAMVLTSQVRQALASDQGQGSVPLTVKVTAPVKLKVGAVKTWKITVKVTCDVTVDKLTATAQIGSTECDYGVDIF